MRSWSLAAAVVALVGACSSSSSGPAPLANCIPNDAGGCQIGSSGGGGSSSSGGSSGGSGSSSGSGDDGGATCSDGGPATSQCQQCAESRCNSQLSQCQNSNDCEALLTCIAYCPTTVCVNTCESQHMASVSMYNALTTCLTTACPTCSESGAGDPCGPTSNACDPTSSCLALWCTRTCATSADCTGLGACGGNFRGQPGACRQLSNGRYCFPGCQTTVDCQSFPGTFCNTVTDVGGATVSVCAFAPDAGLD